MTPSKAARKIRAWNEKPEAMPPRLRLTQERYRRSLAPGSCRLRWDGDADKQVANYMRAQVHQSQIETMVRQVLCAHGVPTVMFVPYFAFARRLDRLARVFSGPTLFAAAASLVGRWQAQGLELSVLDHVCRDVFSLSLDDCRRTMPDEATSK